MKDRIAQMQEAVNRWHNEAIVNGVKAAKWKEYADALEAYYPFPSDPLNAEHFREAYERIQKARAAIKEG